MRFKRSPKIPNDDVASEPPKVLIAQTPEQIDDLGFQKMAIAFANNGDRLCHILS